MVAAAGCLTWVRQPLRVYVLLFIVAEDVIAVSLNESLLLWLSVSIYYSLLWLSASVYQLLLWLSATVNHSLLWLSVSLNQSVLLWLC